MAIGSGSSEVVSAMRTGNELIGRRGLLKMWKVCLLLFYLLILSRYDYREKRVPAVLLYVGLVAAVLLLAGEMFSGQMTWGYLGGILPGIFLLLVAVITRKAGMADGIVLSIVGVVLGYQDTMLLFCISLLLFCVVAIILLLFRKINSKETIPYLPFLTVAVAIQQVI